MRPYTINILVRSQWSFCLLVLAVFALLAVSNVSAANLQRPNILWIIADDLSPDLGTYGYDAVRTPHIDRLASQGVRYTNAFSTAPVCSASRSAFITGMYQTTIGAHSHRMTRNTKRDLPAGIVPITEYFRKEGYFVTNANSNVSDKGKTDYNFKFRESGRMYDGFDWANRDPGQPFFAQVQIFQPHRKLLKNKDVDRLKSVTFPSYYPDHPVTRADWANYLVSVEELDRKVGLILDRLENEGLADDTIVMFFGDHGRPHVRDKQWLYDGGLRVPLIVRNPLQPNAGTVNNNAVSLIDVGVGSLALTGASLPEHMQGVDMFDPTFKGRDAVFASRDRSGNVQDRVRSVQVGNLKLIRNYDPTLPYMTGSQESFYKRLEYPVHALFFKLHEAGHLTPDQAKFLASSRPPEELYDLSSDPEELKNLVDDPAYADALGDLEGRLDSWVQQTDGAGNYPLDAEVELGLQNASVDWGTKQLAARGFSVDGDRTRELQWWSKKLGLNKMVEGSAKARKKSQVQAGASSNEYASPQVTLETAKLALAKKDYAKFCDCFSDDGLRLLVGSLRIVSQMVVFTGRQPKATATNSRLSEVFTRINERYMPKESEEDPELNFMASSHDMMESIRALSDPIEDKSGYIGDVLSVFASSEDRPLKKPMLADAELRNLSITETTATAMMNATFLKPGKGDEPIAFLRVGDTWKIEQIGEYGFSTKQSTAEPKEQKTPREQGRKIITPRQATQPPRHPTNQNSRELPSIEDLRPVDRPDGKGFSELHRAVMGRDLEKVKELLDQGADVDVRQRTYHGTPLQYAASFGRLEAARLLLENKASVDSTDAMGRTPLMWAAWKGHAELVEALLDAGAEVNLATPKKWTALHYAASKKQREAAKLLVERGANISMENAQGKTPVQLDPNVAND